MKAIFRLFGLPAMLALLVMLPASAQTTPATEAWYAEFLGRKGKMTASNATAIGNVGKGLDTYILDLMADSYSSGEYENYTNAHMERGNELEESARSIYELQTGHKVEQVGFVEYNEFAGCSPDGLVGEDGLIEIKCQADKKHFRLMLNGVGEIDSGYIWQMQMQLLVTGRKWIDFVAYNPNFKNSLIIHRMQPDLAMHARLLEGFKIGEAKIKLILNQLTK